MNYSAYDTNGIVGPVEVDTTRTLGRGATASVYVAKLAGQEFAAKIYHNDYLMDFAKIWAMLANPPTNVRLQFAGEQYPQLAWPSAVLGDTNKRSIGYLMPLVDMSKAFSMDHYYDQILVKKLGSPSELALSYKLEIGRNLTLLLADLHDHGHYFIDMKPQNINVLRGSHVVTLLDCDGFSITGADGKRFPAALVSTDYISPEAFKNSSNPESLGEGQDRYALAVILFHPVRSPCQNHTRFGHLRARQSGSAKTLFHHWRAGCRRCSWALAPRTPHRRSQPPPGEGSCRLKYQLVCLSSCAYG